MNLLMAKIAVDVVVTNKLAVNNLRVDLFMKMYTSFYGIYNYYKSFEGKIQMFFEWVYCFMKEENVSRETFILNCDYERIHDQNSKVIADCFTASSFHNPLESTYIITKYSRCWRIEII